MEKRDRRRGMMPPGDISSLMYSGGYRAGSRDMVSYPRLRSGRCVNTDAAIPCRQGYCVGLDRRKPGLK